MPPHLRVYRFDPGSVFEGGLVGAVERTKVGLDTKLLDALFVTLSMLDFRLDAGRHQAVTERTLAEHRGGVPRPLIEAIAATLEAGAAIFAVLHTGGAPSALDEAVARSHGRLIANHPVDARALAHAGPQLLAAVGASPGSAAR
jgi:hypothetical protein